MRSKLSFIIASSFLMFLACNNDAGVVITETNHTGVSKNVANIYVEGMMCAQGCAGKIQKELALLDCVVEASVDFDESRDLDIATVEFDGEQCTVDDMINKVNSIADGAYEVRKVELETYSPASSSEIEEQGSAYNYNKAFSWSALFKSVTVILDLR